MRSGPPLRAPLGLASDELRQSAGSLKVRPNLFIGTGFGAGVVRRLFCGERGLLILFYRLVFLQFNHGDAPSSPGAPVRFSGWNARAGSANKQVCW